MQDHRKEARSGETRLSETPALQDISKLRSFLGLVNYYGRRCKHSPLYALIKKQIRWSWGANKEEASLPLILSCDASPYRLGAMLSPKMPNEEERPVGFASRTLIVFQARPFLAFVLFFFFFFFFCI